MTKAELLDLNLYLRNDSGYTYLTAETDDIRIDVGVLPKRPFPASFKMEVVDIMKMVDDAEAEARKPKESEESENEDA